MGTMSKLFGGRESGSRPVENQSSPWLTEAAKAESERRGNPPTKLDPEYDIIQIMAKQSMLDIINEL